MFSGNRSLNRLGRDSIKHFHLPVSGEPSPEIVDNAASDFRDKGIDVVLAVGGGSAIDAGKAISSMLPQEASILDYLEGVGTGKHDGLKVPLIAVPTTAGTGSEATKNAVLSRVGPEGFKKSLRHDNFVPDVAVVDPALMMSCPGDVTASCGMDAFTQLIESYVSTGAAPMTDALAFSGLEALKDNLLPARTSGAGDVEVRSGMAYASLISGITLANAGLGVVHGFAAAIGSLFEIPHGVICGPLAGAATGANIEALKDASEAGKESLMKHAKVGALLGGRDATDIDGCCRALFDTIEEWTETLALARLGEYGVAEVDIERILEKTELKSNPATLSGEALRDVLSERI